MKIISVGEVLWDVFGEKEFLGGAPLNFAAASQRLGSEVALVSAVGADARGARALDAMKRLGVATEFVASSEDRATGAAIVSTDSCGNTSFVIDRPAAFDCVPDDERMLERLRSFEADWVYFGTLAQTDSKTESMLRALIAQSSGVKCFYDMNLRDGHWNLPLVQRLSRLATVLKLNDAEAKLLSGLTRDGGDFCLEEFCRYWASTFQIETICVTLGGDGCAIYREGRFGVYAGYEVCVVDTVGAGDAFAAAFLNGIESGRALEDTAAFANALGALVASRAGATPEWNVDECMQLWRGKKQA